MKNRILLLIWFILLALAAVFTGVWVYAVLLLLSALAVVAFLLLGFFCGKKITMKLKLPKAAEQDGIWKGKLQIANESVLPVFLGKGSLHLENHFTGEQMELPFSFSLKGRGKKPLTSREKASGAVVFTPPYTPGAPMISLVWQGKRGRRGCPLVRW